MTTDAGRDARVDVSKSSSEQLKARVRSWWNARPCGIEVSRQAEGSRAFFDEVARHRYTQEAHIPEVFDFASWQGKRVLEIGCGLGTDLSRFAEAGAWCVGIDLTPRAVELSALHLAGRGLVGRFANADAESLAFRSASFDLVYAHGVLHHTPDTERAISEVHRLLRPGGTAIVMLYHKNSFNYWVNIRVFRRVGLLLLRSKTGQAIVRTAMPGSEEVLERYKRLSGDGGRWDAQELLNNNTDGPGNPLSKVVTRREARAAFRQFSEVRTRVHWLVKKNIPLLGRWIPAWVDYYLGRLVGWDLYVIASK